MPPRMRLPLSVDSLIIADPLGDTGPGVLLAGGALSSLLMY